MTPADVATSEPARRGGRAVTRQSILNLQAFTGASRNHTPFPNSSFSLLTFPIVPENKKAAEAFLRPAAF